MTEGLEPAVGVHGQLAAGREGAARDVLLGGSLLAEAEVLVGEQLGQREAVVHLGHVDLAARIRDAGLAVSRLRGGRRRLPGGEVVAGLLPGMRAVENG